MELSIILPVRNIQREIPGILTSAAGETAGHDTEFIVVDMGSNDQTVLEAVQTLKELNLRGFVIQNGSGTVSAALNTGIQKAGGDYITFLFARRLYHNFIQGSFAPACTSADFIFGTVNREDAAAAVGNGDLPAVSLSGADCVKMNLKGSLPMDISAVFVKHSMIAEKRICFSDQCSYGYAEEFVFRCLLASGGVEQSPAVLTRNMAIELKRGKQKPTGKNIFQHTDAMLRILDLTKGSLREDKELTSLLQYDKIPRTVMNGVDVMLKEGAKYNTVRAILRSAGYDKLLLQRKLTDAGLKRRVWIWQTLPWMYHVK